MKSILIILISLCSFCVFSQEKEYRIAYSIEYINDSTNIGSKKTEDFYLFSSTTSSNFVSVNHFLRDSIRYYGLKNKVNIFEIKEAFSKVRKSKFNFYLEKNSVNQNVIFYKPIVKYLGYEMKKLNLDWQIIDSIKVIGNYTCQKAKLVKNGISYEAWFTKDISIFDGPYMFSGLPGLILELECLEKMYKFSFIGIERSYINNEVSNIVSNLKIAAITNDKNEFDKLTKDWQKNGARYSLENGDVSGLSDEDKEKIIKMAEMHMNKASNKPRFELELF